MRNHVRFTMLGRLLPRMSGLLRMAHSEKCVTGTGAEDLRPRVAIISDARVLQSSPYSSYVMFPFPTSSMSRSFQPPCALPPYLDSGAAQSRTRATEQSRGVITAPIQTVDRLGGGAAQVRTMTQVRAVVSVRGPTRASRIVTVVSRDDVSVDAPAVGDFLRRIGGLLVRNPCLKGMAATLTEAHSHDASSPQLHMAYVISRPVDSNARDIFPNLYHHSK